MDGITVYNATLNLPRLAPLFSQNLQHRLDGTGNYHIFKIKARSLLRASFKL